MARPNVCEGTIPPEDVLSPEALRTPGAELFSGTHWRVAGEIDSGLPPLLCLHGGPGSTCAYFELLDDLAAGGRAVVTYDQIGCGGSFLDGVPSLWRAETWLAELEAVVSHLGLDDFHLLGQSWGGMLAITYLAERRPPQVRSVILSSTLSSSALWGREQRRMARQLPEAADAPDCLRRPKRSGRESYVCAWGPDELTPRGTLRDWDYTDRLPDIDVPALVVSGTDDLCTPLVAKTMADALPRSRWELLEDCRHLCFADDRPRYLELLRSWLADVETGAI